jgi:hypothetical protein
MVLVHLLQISEALVEMAYSILYLEQQHFMQAVAEDVVVIWDLQQVAQA